MARSIVIEAASREIRSEHDRFPASRTSVFAPFEDHLAMLLKCVQARLQSMKHRDGAIDLLSLLNQLVNDPFLPSNTLLDTRNVSLGLGQIVLLKGVVHGRKLTPGSKLPCEVEFRLLSFR